MYTFAFIGFDLASSVPRPDFIKVDLQIRWCFTRASVWCCIISDGQSGSRHICWKEQVEYGPQDTFLWYPGINIHLGAWLGSLWCERYKHNSWWNGWGKCFFSLQHSPLCQTYVQKSCRAKSLMFEIVIDLLHQSVDLFNSSVLAPKTKLMVGSSRLRISLSNRLRLWAVECWFAWVFASFVCHNFYYLSLTREMSLEEHEVKDW